MTPEECLKYAQDLLKKVLIFNLFLTKTCKNKQVVGIFALMHIKVVPIVYFYLW